MHPYVAEDFTDAEVAVLRRYFTNLQGPGLCPGQPARSRQGCAVRALLALLQEPAPPFSR